MRYSFASSGRSASSGTFTVRTGGEHFVSVHAPLGRSSVKKPIKPVYPYYVTEYESAFQWPPEWAYGVHRCGKYTSCARCKSKDEDNGTKETKLADLADSNWQSLLSTVSRLLELNYEKELMNALKEPIANRKLNLVLEYVNGRFVDTIAAMELHRAENGEYPEVPSNSKDVLDLCKQFTSAVRAIKAC